MRRTGTPCGYNSPMQLSPELVPYAGKLQQYLSQRRLEHSHNVAGAARRLAMIYAPNLQDEAELAGLLHDNAKALSAAELIQAAQRFDIELSAGEHRCPSLLHGKIGAALLPERFGIDDAQIARAVADHVTGQTNMTTLSCILFVADQIAADRQFDGVDELRAVATVSLVHAAFLVAKHKLLYIVQREHWLEPSTMDVYNEFLDRMQAHGA